MVWYHWLNSAMPDLKVGDRVEVYVETQEDKNGQLILSQKSPRTQIMGSR